MVLKAQNEGIYINAASTPIVWAAIRLNTFLLSTGAWQFNNTPTTYVSSIPTGLKTYGLIYNSAYIYKTKVTVQIVNGDNLQKSLVMFATPDTLPTAPTFGSDNTTTQIDIREQPGIRQTSIAPIGSGNNSKTISATYSTKKLLGNRSVYDENWWVSIAGGVYTNPVTTTYLYMNLWQTGNYTNVGPAVPQSFQYKVILKYYVRLFDKNILAADQ